MSSAPRADSAARERLFATILPQLCPSARFEQSHPARDQVVQALRSANRQDALDALRAGFRLARADGYIAEGEISLIMELAIAAGIEEDAVMKVGRIPDLGQAFLAMERLLN